jgi:hypothetical protein
MDRANKWGASFVPRESLDQLDWLISDRSIEGQESSF